MHFFVSGSQRPVISVALGRMREETSEIELGSDVQKTIYPDAAAATDSHRTCHILWHKRVPIHAPPRAVISECASRELGRRMQEWLSPAHTPLATSNERVRRLSRVPFHFFLPFAQIFQVTCVQLMSGKNLHWQRSGDKMGHENPFNSQQIDEHCFSETACYAKYNSAASYAFYLRRA